MKIQKQRVPTDKCRERATKLFHKLNGLLSQYWIDEIALALDAEYWKGAADTERARADPTA